MTLYGLSDSDVAKIKAAIKTADAAARYESIGGRGSPRGGALFNLHLGKTSSDWNKGSTATVTLYEAGTAGSEAEGGGTVSAVNKFADVKSGKWVFVARAANGVWYLIAAEC